MTSLLFSIKKLAALIDKPVMQKILLFTALYKYEVPLWMAFLILFIACHL